ncbi:MAG: hypothetical protein WCC12_06510, partial [Anaerolineales bacterium]
VNLSLRRLIVSIPGLNARTADADRGSLKEEKRNNLAAPNVAQPAGICLTRSIRLLCYSPTSRSLRLFQAQKSLVLHCQQLERIVTASLAILVGQIQSEQTIIPIKITI